MNTNAELKDIVEQLTRKIWKLENDRARLRTLLAPFARFAAKETEHWKTDVLYAAKFESAGVVLLLLSDCRAAREELEGK